MDSIGTLVTDLIGKALIPVGAAIVGNGLATQSQSTAIVGGVAAGAGVLATWIISHLTRRKVADNAAAIGKK